MLILGVMDERWHLHNLHRCDGLEAFLAHDPTLRRLREAALVHESDLLDDLMRLPPGIYTIGGGRQVGKTTLVKQFMVRLLRRGDEASDICYITGELIRGADDFRRELTEAAEGSADGLRHLFVDEITFVDQWPQVIKFLADAGILERVVLIITGSDLVVMQDALKQLPGRRGPAPIVDFLYRPLTFRAFCCLRRRLPLDAVGALSAGEPGSPLPEIDAATMAALEDEFVTFHRSGGYLSAVNDLERHGTIQLATYRTYSDWIRGDFVKRGKGEAYLREILEAIVRRYASQVTWNALSRELSIDHPKTISDYVALLERMEAAFVLPALREDQLRAAPKKARKVFFADPFIYHAVREFLYGPTSPAKLALTADETELAKLVESSIVSHARRRAPAFYIKAQGEVDLAYIEHDRVCPVEVKWSTQIRPKDLKQVAKYGNGIVAGKVRAMHRVSGVPVLPAPVVLLRLS